MLTQQTQMGATNYDVKAGRSEMQANQDPTCHCRCSAVCVQNKVLGSLRPSTGYRVHYKLHKYQV
jgi:hypothetical protein